MNSLNFENRVSLTRKSENLAKIIEELSSSYEKRESFAAIKILPQLHTSEVGLAVVFVLIAAVIAIGGVITMGWNITHCETEFSGECFAYYPYATTDSVTYSNIV